MLCLEYVAHNWRYERLLTLSLSSFVLHPPKTCRVKVTICYCPEDEPAVRVLDYFAGLPPVENVRWNWMPMDAPRLCRRAIGRNIACKESTADFLLLSDIDYIFGPGALDVAAAKLAEANASGPKLCWPRKIRASVSHEDGDAEIARVTEPGVYDLKGNYEPSILVAAIGGCQWIPGNWARERGYLPNHPRYQQPSEIWQRTYCDKNFRRQSGLPEIPLRIPNVYRCRHSSAGRFQVGCRN
jgi:hypothetical protein